MKHVVRLVAAALGATMLVACSVAPVSIPAAPTTSVAAPSPPKVTTSKPTAPTVAKSSTAAKATASAVPTDPAAVLAANQAACSDLEDRMISSGLATMIAYYDADSSKVLPSGMQQYVQKFKIVQPVTVDPIISSALLAFNKAAQFYSDAAPVKLTVADLTTVVAAYKSVLVSCQPFIVPKPVQYIMNCYVDFKANTMFKTYQEAWSGKASNCLGQQTQGTILSELEQNVLAVGKYEFNDLRSVYGQCASIDNEWVKTEYSVLSAEQTVKAQAMLTLCPDHPQAATIQTNIDTALAATAVSDAKGKAVEAQKQLVADGKYVTAGKYLVGADIQPGTWRSVGDQVEDCYWETSDGSGNIMDNNFISIAPQFTITIPSDAAGFTNSGCEFEWVG